MNYLLNWNCKYSYYSIFQGSYSHRDVDSDVLGISHANLSIPLMYNDAPKVLFAGEATLNEYYSAVHGAMESAVRAVDMLIDYFAQQN